MDEAIFKLNSIYAIFHVILKFYSNLFVQL